VDRRADLLSAARGAHHAGESRVAIPGAGSAAGGDHHALAIAEKQWSASDGPVLPLVVHLSSLGGLHGHARNPQQSTRVARWPSSA